MVNNSGVLVEEGELDSIKIIDMSQLNKGLYHLYLWSKDGKVMKVEKVIKN